MVDRIAHANRRQSRRPQEQAEAQRHDVLAQVPLFACLAPALAAVLLMTGHANGGKAQWDNYMSKVYHTPADDLSQAINWDAGARYARLNYRIARAMADAPQRPMWLQGDYFGELFDPAGPRAPMTASGKP